MAKHTGQPVEQIERDMDRDFFMSAEEAKKYGIIDSVITQPVDGSGQGGTGGGEVGVTFVTDLIVVRRNGCVLPLGSTRAHPDRAFCL